MRAAVAFTGRTVGIAVISFTASCGNREGGMATVPTPRHAIEVGTPQRPLLFEGLPDCLAGQEPFRPPKCWALEDGKDDAFVEYSEKLSPTPSPHPSSAKAIQNIVACVASGERNPVLIGHGWPGGICTGLGAGCFNEIQRQISFTDPNRKYWYGYTDPKGTVYEPWIPRVLPELDSLTLLSCSTGAGDDGATLLFNLATSFNCDIWARTGRVWANGKDIWVDAAGCWQVAKKGAKGPPPKIDEPTVPVAPTAPPVIFAGGLQAQLDSESLYVSELSSVQGLAPGAKVPVTSGESDGLARNANLSQPCYTYAALASVPLLQVPLERKDGKGPKLNKRLQLLSGGVLQDIDNLRIYYRVSSEFGGFIADAVSRYKETHHLPP